MKGMVRKSRIPQSYLQNCRSDIVGEFPEMGFCVRIKSKKEVGSFGDR